MNMNIPAIFTEEHVLKLIKVALIIGIGYPALRLLIYIIRRSFWKNLSRQSVMLWSKGIEYTGVFIIGVIVFQVLKWDIKTLFGAAGLVGIIVGIASQTSIGNVISGFFLISEKPFELGDVIKVGDKTGVVHSVDLLSIKLKTFDNLLIRIPNQTIISTELVNVTRFPIRRLDFQIGVAYKEDLRKVQDILKKIAKENPLCLDEPEPVIIFSEFGNSSINILFGVWFEKNNFVKVKNSIFLTIKETFDKEGIEIPFPHTSLYSGEATKPFPIKIVGEDQKK